MKLAPYLRARDIEPGDFAEELGVADETLRRYLIGTRIPVPDVMRRIVELCRGWVTPNDFFDLDALVPGAFRQPTNEPGRWFMVPADGSPAGARGGGGPCTANAAPEGATR
jgi:hypothetical protein